MKNITKRIKNEGKIDQLEKYYARYEDSDQALLENSLVRYLLNFKRHLLEIKGNIPDVIYDKLDVRRQLALEEEHRIRDNIFCDPCTLVIVDKMKNILGKAKPQSEDQNENHQ